MTGNRVALRRPLIIALALALAASAFALPRGGPAFGQAVAPAPRGGHWLVASDGGVFALGTAPFRGSAGAIRLNRPMVGMATTPAGSGYWLIASDGGVFSFGDARFAGSTGAIRLNQPIVGMAPTPTGAGYWMVARDGGVFAFGDARFSGSLGLLALNRPIVGMAATPTGRGYWLVASDGGIFAFGDARFAGSTGGRPLSAPIVGMAASGLDGYWLAGADGRVYPFGTAQQFGPPAGRDLGRPIVAITANGGGYSLVGNDGAVFNFGETQLTGDRPGLRLNSPVVGGAVPPFFPGESILPGTYVERPEMFGSVIVRNGVPAVGGVAIADCFCRKRVSFSAVPSPQQGSRNVVFDARLSNATGLPIEFPGGVLFRFNLRRNGQPWRTVDVRNPAITSLPPGGVVTATMQVEPEGDGTYEPGAEVTIVIR